MADILRIGCTRLSLGDGQAVEYKANIIFIHGLRGHPKSTWEGTPQKQHETNQHAGPSRRKPWRTFFNSKNNSKPNSKTDDDAANKIFWPEDYLVEDMPNAIIWTYGFNADVVGGFFKANNQNSLSQHGQDLAARLEREIDNMDPLLFVAHSLGGIILKDAIRRSSIIRSRTKAIVFLGTPHRGSGMASWGHIAANLAQLALQDSNKKIIESLEVSGEVLDNIHDEFKVIVQENAVQLYSFQEARGITGMKGFQNKVVSDFSSKLDLPRSLERVESIDADHMEMVKCTSRLDPRYRAISGVLKIFVRVVLEKSDPVKEPELAARNDTASTGKFFVPFPHNPNFVGHDDDLSFIFNNVHNAVESQKSCLVHGIGGVGKTQIMLEFAYRFRSKFRYIFWLPAQDEAAVSAAYSNIAISLSLQGSESRPNPLTIELVRRWLCEHSGWLLIFDNVEGHPSDFNQFWPPCHHGSIVLTSQRTDHSLRTQSNLKLEPLGQQEGSQLLLRYLPKGNNSIQMALIEMLCEEVDGLPLLLVALGGFISHSHMYTALDDILQSLRSSRVATGHIFSDNSTNSAAFQYERPINLVFRLALDQLPAAAKTVIKIMSMLSPEDIPESIFFQPTSASFLEPSLLSNPILFAKEVRKNLGARHLTEIHVRSSEVVYSMHRSVQREVLNILDDENTQLEVTFNRAVDLIHAKLPKPSPIMVPLFEFHRYTVFISHVLNICRIYTQSQSKITPTIRFAEMICSAVAYLYESGLTQSCLDLTTTGESVCEQLSQAPVTSQLAATPGCLAFGLPQSLPRLRANILAYGAGVLWTTGGIKNRQQAHQIGWRITLLREKYIDETSEDSLSVDDHVLQANAYNDWALQLINEGRYTQARLFSQKSLETKEHLIGNNQQQFEFYSSKIHLAVISLAENAPIKALATANEAIAHVEREKGPDDPYTRICKFHVANVYASVGKYRQAAEMHKTVLGARIGIFGETHNDTLNAYYALAFCQFRGGELKEASKNVALCLEKSQAAQWAEECVLRARYLESLVMPAVDGSASWDHRQREAILKRNALLAQFAEGNWSLPVDGQDEFIFFDYLVNYSAGRVMIMQLDG